MKAGTLRHRITFQRKTESRNDFQESVAGYADAFTVWGSVIPNAGRKFYESLQASAEVSGEIRIRYRSDVEPTMRIRLGARTLKIASIANIGGRNAELLIYYKEVLD